VVGHRACPTYAATASSTVVTASRPIATRTIHRWAETRRPCAMWCAVPRSSRVSLSASRLTCRTRSSQYDLAQYSNEAISLAETQSSGGVIGGADGDGDGKDGDDDDGHDTNGHGEDGAQYKRAQC
jgi:hypothetical protein